MLLREIGLYRGPLAEVAVHETPEVDAVYMRCGCAGCAKSFTSYYDNLATAFGPDYVGDGPKTSLNTALILTPDVVAGDTGTTSVLTVGAPSTIGTLETIGDQDFYRVDLVAGQTYEFGMYAKTGGPNLVGVADAYLELYGPDGKKIVDADGGAATTLNLVNSGFDVLLSFQATKTGAYYINARAFDQDATNGTAGDFVGDYELFARTADPANVYVPFYSPESPLHSLDWGSQIDRTSRNPDGNNGTRTDNGVVNGGSPINPGTPYEGKNVVYVYYAKTGDVFVSENPTSPGLTENIVALGLQDWEKRAFEAAFDIYEQVADVIYVETQNRNEADFKIITYKGTPGAGASLLGRMSPPNEQNEGQMEINSGDVRWTEEGVSPGGFYFPTLLHELGHGHGMAHPHDNGGRSSVMPGADGGTGGLGGGFGQNGLSQQVYTIMSYNDGWNETDAGGGRPTGHGGPRSGGITATEVDHYGWVGTLSPLDIAVIQDKYGVNEEWARGNDVYTIADQNGPGVYYRAIWDGGGTDEIRYVGARDASIDLRAATLKYEEGGGGRVSYALGAWSGFTIANGVTIENATSGDGNDLLVGNAARNRLSSGGGADTLEGGAGADTLDGGAGFDTVSYASASAGVSVDLRAGKAYRAEADQDVLISIEGVVLGAFNDTAQGGAAAERIEGGAGADRLLAGDGRDTVSGGVGADDLFGQGGADEFWFRTGDGADRVHDFQNDVDLIVFDHVTGIDGFADLVISSNAAGQAVVTYGAGDSLTLNVRAALLDARDFVFVTDPPPADDSDGDTGGGGIVTLPLIGTVTSPLDSGIGLL